MQKYTFTMFVLSNQYPKILQTSQLLCHFSILPLCVHPLAFPSDFTAFTLPLSITISSTALFSRKVPPYSALSLKHTEPGWIMWTEHDPWWLHVTVKNKNRDDLTALNITKKTNWTFFWTTSGQNLKSNCVTWQIPEVVLPARTQGRYMDWRCGGSETPCTAWSVWWFPNTARPGNYRKWDRPGFNIKDHRFSSGLCKFLWLTCRCCVRLWHDLWTPWRLGPGQSGRTGLVWSFCQDRCPGRSEGFSHQSSGQRVAASWTFSCQTCPSDLKHKCFVEYY